VEWPLLAPLSDSERTHVLKSASTRTFRRGETIVREGDVADSLHLIQDGRIAICVALSSGERVMLNVLSTGGYFGELSLVRWNGRRRRTATAIALEAATTLSLTHETFESLCSDFPAVEQLLVASLATRIEELSSRLLEAMYVGLERRVYRCLIRMLEIYGSGMRSEVIPLTQDQLADLVGGSRPSINQVLRRLADQGVIEIGRGRLVVREPAVLHSKAGIVD
jgi:CRP-like cAMP-binding protein